ncbi:MAG: hypothetical protein ABIH26_07845 [Candidatus Eisenbacteria bacterium]
MSRTRESENEPRPERRGLPGGISMADGWRFIGLEHGDDKERLFALHGTPPAGQIRVNRETKRVLVCYYVKGSPSDSIGVIYDVESERITFVSVLADAEGGGREVKDHLSARGISEPLLDFLGRRPCDLIEALGPPSTSGPEASLRYDRGNSTLAFEAYDRDGGRISRISVFYWHDPES